MCESQRSGECENLKPCPFCGGEAKRFTISEDDHENLGGDVIECSRCMASSHVEFGRKENLVSGWNDRVPMCSGAAQIVSGLLAYIEELEAHLDAADESLSSEGGCGTREWREGTPEFRPRDQRFSYVRDDHVDSLGAACAFLDDAA